MPASPTSGFKNPLDWREFLGQIKSRGILLSFTLAFGIWLYVSLNGSYSTFIEVPVIVITNENQAIESELPNKLLVEIKGRGWDLLNLKYIHKSFESKVDLSKLNQNTSEVEITHSKLLQSLTALEQIEIKNINPDYFVIKLGEVESKNVPVKSNITITPRKGFVQVGEVNLNPQEINIKGFDKIIKKINAVYTNDLDLTDIFRKTTGRVNILDTFNQRIRIKPKGVEYSIEIQQNCNVDIKQVKIEIRGGQFDISHRIAPSKINITLQGGVEEIAKMNIEDIKAYLDYKEIMNDTTGILVPKIILPPNINLVRTEPRFIYHNINKSGLLN